MEVVGYAIIKKDAKTGKSANPISQFTNAKYVRVMEFAANGFTLVLNPEGTALGSFEKEDVLKSFRCQVQGEVLVPPELDFINAQIYQSKVLLRKGGYNPMLKQMVIATSLHKGEFTDNFLFSKQ